MDFTGAIKRPFTSAKKLIIGCVLYIIPIVNFFSVGYSLECARLTFKKKKQLPEWTAWGGLFVHGLLSAIIGLIYAIPAIILFMIGAGVAGASILSSFASGQLAGLSGLLAAAPIFVVAFLVMLLTLYVAPSAILGYAQKFKFGEAFKFGTVFKKAFTGRYFGAWIVAIIVGLVLSFVLGWIPVVGAPVAGFISLVISMTLLAEAYK